MKGEHKLKDTSLVHRNQLVGKRRIAKTGVRGGWWELSNSSRTQMERVKKKKEGLLVFYVACPLALGRRLWKQCAEGRRRMISHTLGRIRNLGCFVTNRMSYSIMRIPESPR